MFQTFLLLKILGSYYKRLKRTQKTKQVKSVSVAFLGFLDGRCWASRRRSNWANLETLRPTSFPKDSGRSGGISEEKPCHTVGSRPLRDLGGPLLVLFYQPASRILAEMLCCLPLQSVESREAQRRPLNSAPHKRTCACVSSE